ncbi:MULTISPECIES: hypothetical protein [unclassified Iodidimonas]|jgi:cell division transport system permease protein|uniref:cell division protein FtsX n=1 Tax=unclassified Iodidimonas TaxID=2626145 RepID=UPI0024821A67|nr:MULTISPECIES: hypothetical protein [unclassified Iodidimonas]
MRWHDPQKPGGFGRKNPPRSPGHGLGRTPKPFAGQTAVRSAAFSPAARAGLLSLKRKSLRFLPENSLAGGTLPWVIGIMVFLCTLASIFAFALHQSMGDWADKLSQQISVQIVTADGKARRQQADAALALLPTIPGIENAVRLSDAESKALLEPWLGAGNVTDDLPVPILIEVTTSPGARIDLAALKAQVQQVAPDANLDDHERWLVQLNRLSTSLQMVALLVVGLILSATAAIAAFGTRAGLSSHRASIEIMHHMGAEDGLIANEFRYRFMLQGLKGGLGGLIAGLLVMLTLGHFASQIGSGLVPDLSLSALAWLLLILLPVFAALLTMMAAHLTVHRELAGYP